MIFTTESKFEIDDKVVVHNSGLRFPSCDELADKLNLKLFKRNEYLENKTSAKITNMVLWRGRVICGILTSDNREFAIDEAGLKLITNK